MYTNTITNDVLKMTVKVVNLSAADVNKKLVWVNRF